MHQAQTGGFPWGTFWSALGAIVALIGLAGGAVFALAYARRASASVTAKLHKTAHGTFLSTRPAVTALGPFNLHFAERDQPTVIVTEVLITPEGGTTDGRPQERLAFPKDDHGNDQFVTRGETLTSAQLFRVDPHPEALVGWRVEFKFAAAGRVRRGLHWADRDFVSLPN